MAELARVEFDIDGFDSLKETISKSPAIANKHIYAAVHECQQLANRDLREIDGVTPRVTGMLQQSMGVSEIVFEQDVTLGVVFSPLIYALPVELGVKPRPRKNDESKMTKGFEGRRMFGKTLANREGDFNKIFAKHMNAMVNEIMGAA